MHLKNIGENPINSKRMIRLDVPTAWNVRLQDSGSPSQEGLEELYNEIMYYMIIIWILIGYLLWRLKNRKEKISLKYIKHNQWLEIIWTIIPSIILLMISIPSFIILYMNEELKNPKITIKVIGMQWYWKYEYSDYIKENGEKLELESYILEEEMLWKGGLRMLETDNTIILPINTKIRFIVTSNDVIHSFTIPSLGFKIDAIPGRLNQVNTLILREGVYYGQCSELCGINHGLMPIKLESVSMDTYLNWLKENLKFL